MTCKAPVTPGLRPGYDQAATENCWNLGQIVKRTYDWSHRSCVIARANPVAARSMVMFKTSNLQLQIVSGRRYVLRDRTTSRVWSHHQLWIIANRAVARLVVCSTAKCVNSAKCVNKSYAKCVNSAKCVKSTLNVSKVGPLNVSNIPTLNVSN